MTARMIEREQQVLEAIKAAGSVKASEMAQSLGLTTRQATAALWRMKGNGMVVSVGRSVQSRWCIPGSEEEARLVAAKEARMAECLRDKERKIKRIESTEWKPKQLWTRAESVPRVPTVWDLAA